MADQLPNANQQTQPQAGGVDKVNTVKTDFFGDNDQDASSGGIRKEVAQVNVQTQPDAEIEKMKAELALKLKEADLQIAEFKGLKTKSKEDIDAANKQKELDNAPKDLYEALGIDKEEFLFDMDEAMYDPKSDSAKMMAGMMAVNLNPMLEKQKNETINAITSQIQEKENRERIATFRQSHDLVDDNSYNAFQEYINNAKFGLEEAYSLWAAKSGRMQGQGAPPQQNNFSRITEQQFNPVQPRNQFPQSISGVRTTNAQQQPLTFSQMLGEEGW